MFRRPPKPHKGQEPVVFGRQGCDGHVWQNQQLTLSVPGETGPGGLPLALRLREGLGVTVAEDTAVLIPVHSWNGS